MTLKERFDQLEPREQRLLGILVVVFGALVVLLIPILVAAMVSSRQEHHQALRESIDRIFAGREKIDRRDADKKRLADRYGRAAPPLAGYLSKLAMEYAIDVPESQDRANIPHGKKFDERSTKLVLKKVGMLALVNFLEKVENAGFPVRVSNLNIRKRGTEDDSYDVNLVVSAFDRKEVKGETPAAGAGSGGAAGQDKPPAAEGKEEKEEEEEEE